MEIYTMSSNETHALLKRARQLDQEIVEAEEVEHHAPHGTQLLAWTIKMALADNHLDEREKKMLLRVAQQRKIKQRQLETLIEAVQNNDLDVPTARDAKTARLWLAELADVSLWDGNISQEEYQLLCQAAAHYDYSALDVKTLLRERRAQLYRNARQHLLERKQHRNGQSRQ
jgi:tellurite resistance protein